MRISLVVPVKNEAHGIGRLLGSISRQARIPDEAVFVDAGSSDGTEALIKNYKDERFGLKLISIPSAYPGTARNEGVKAASNDYIAFTDGGIVLDERWLEELCRIADEDGQADVVYGNYVPNTDTFFKRCLAMAFVPPALLVNGARRRPRFIASSMMRKAVWQTVGGFPDLRAGEDRIFMEAIERKGFRTRYAPHAKVVWDIPSNIKETWGRFYAYSFHDLKAERIHDWHVPVSRMYLISLIFIYLAVFVRSAFIVLPFIGYAVRVLIKIISNSHEPYFKWSRVPLYFIAAGTFIFLIDMAMFAGWLKYYTVKNAKTAGSRPTYG